ncbi:SDR family NAD(P)-dependent oxidoreductase [Latilactobacillus graminis]|nr:SDR family oxidoreductase [Latilactobacillus graminis]
MTKLRTLRDLNQKIVVITGGSSGLGRAIAYEAASKGAIIVVLARRTAELAAVREQVQRLSGRPAYAYRLDVSDPTAIETIVAQIRAEVGIPDVLVNAAGFGHFENALDTSMTIVEQMFRVNVLGLMYITRAFGRMMIEQGGGHIINIASMAGKMATPKSAIYSATKFAVVGYSNGLRLELKPFGIQVTTVNPGPIDTDFFAIADKTGNYLKSVDWVVLDPDQLAQRIVNAIGHTRREINAPWLMTVGAQLYQLAPHLGDYVAGHVLNKK